MCLAVSGLWSAVIRFGLGAIFHGNESYASFLEQSMPVRFADIGDRFAEIDDVHHSLEKLLEMYERDEAGDMPYPPDYPKMPGEPKRVQPSRDTDRKKK